MTTNRIRRSIILGEQTFKENELSVPTDLTKLAQENDIEVIEKECSAGVSGMLIRYNDKFTIAYATHIDSPEFQRFSIAHELGHFFCPGHVESIMTESNQNIHLSKAGLSNSNNIIEQEADAFAAGLLMPSHICKKVIGRENEGLNSILAIAKTCITSITASAIRYINLSDAPSAIIVSTNTTIDYCICNKKLMRISGYIHPQKNSKLPDTALVIAKQTNPNLDNKSEACSMEWLNTDTEHEIIEEIIKLDKNWLTVLTLPDYDDE